MRDALFLVLFSLGYVTSRPATHDTLKPTLYVKSRIIQHLNIFDQATPDMSQANASDEIMMAEKRAELMTELTKLEGLRERGFPPKIIVSVEDTANLDETSTTIVASLQDYGAELDGVMRAFNMFVIKFQPPTDSARMKSLDIHALEVIKGAKGVKFSEVDSIVEAM